MIKTAIECLNNVKPVWWLGKCGGKPACKWLKFSFPCETTKVKELSRPDASMFGFVAQLPIKWRKEKTAIKWKKKKVPNSLVWFIRKFSKKEKKTEMQLKSKKCIYVLFSSCFIQKLGEKLNKCYLVVFFIILVFFFFFIIKIKF